MIINMQTGKIEAVTKTRMYWRLNGPALENKSNQLVVVRKKKH